MKMLLVTAAASFLIIATALGSGADISPRAPYQPAECCLTYISRVIPRDRILDYYETSSQCTRPGIVFITKKGLSICANPKNNWVRHYIKDLEES